MKSCNQLGLIICLFLLSVNFVQSQKESDCKIVNDNDSIVYTGKCKKGLANGEGVLKFPNNKKMYVGKFKNGKMHGEGELFSLLNGEKKSIKKGIWKKNEYIGEKKIRPYKIVKSINVGRYSVRKIGTEGNRIKFSFFQNGTRNSVENLNIYGDSGIKYGDTFSSNNSVSYIDFEIPFNCKLNYRTLSKLKAQDYLVQLEIVINEPGQWEVTLNN